MKTFNFKLRALLRLKETKREQALANFAASIQEVRRLEVTLDTAQKHYSSVLSVLHDHQKGVFKRDTIESLQNSLQLAQDSLNKTKLRLNQAKDIESSRRKIFLDRDSQFKTILRLQEKQREVHYFKENKKEQSELEDIIGSRFLFLRINEQV